MIVRQFAARHGRSVFASSMRCCKRTYANEISNSDPMFEQSAQDHKPVRTSPGHPSDPSSILDTIAQPPTVSTRSASDSVDAAAQGMSSLQAELNSHIAATHGGTVPSSEINSFYKTKPVAQSPYPDLESFYQAQKQRKQSKQVGSMQRNLYHPDEILRNPPYPAAITLPMLLANQTHLGHATSLWNPANSSYIYGVREGIHIISLEITLAYLRRAAKVVREVSRRGGIILFVGTRKGQQDIVVQTAQRAEGYHIFQRWVPGTLTNGQQILGHCKLKVVNAVGQEIGKYRQLLEQSDPSVLRPDLVVCLNPLENEVCLQECGLFTIPTIGVIDTDANPTHVTYPIPANDDSLRSIALIAGALGRAAEEGIALREVARKEKGEFAFDSSGVNRYLERLEELASIEVQETDATTGKAVE